MKSPFLRGTGAAMLALGATGAAMADVGHGAPAGHVHETVAPLAGNAGIIGIGLATLIVALWLAGKAFAARRRQPVRNPHA